MSILPVSIHRQFALRAVPADKLEKVASFVKIGYTITNVPPY
jgi:hypothetical protein